MSNVVGELKRDSQACDRSSPDLRRRLRNTALGGMSTRKLPEVRSVAILGLS